MKNTQNITIGVLAVTAVILGVLVFFSMQPQPAEAASALPSKGSYVVATGRASGTNKEVLYVINLTSQRMVAYMFNPTKNEISPISGADMKAAFAK